MEENCEDCMQWEEELYWTHFQTLHFSQLLLPGFHNRLAIPQKFSTHCKRKLPKIVTLKSPSGVTYNVGLEEDDEKTLAFCCGWEEFVKDHSLQENDLLVFKFHGVSEFEVLIFDGDSFCEKPTSYFVRKCGHAGKKTKGTDFTERHINLDDVETTLNQQPVISPVASCQIPAMSPPTSTGRISQGKYPISVFKKMRGEISNTNLDSKADVEMISDGSRKSINETCKRKVLSMAKRALSPNGFLVVMKRSHVLSKCFLTIPNTWFMKNMSVEPQEVVMQVDQTKWSMRFNFFETRGRGGVSTGWKKFVQDNNLCIDDVCVFEPDNFETKPFLLQVYIFRVAEAESSNNG